MKFKSVSLSEIFEFPKISAGITKNFIHNNKGNIPVYGSQKNGQPIGFIKDSLKIRYFENCFGWNRNGSVGYVFYHNHKFATTDDHRPMCIKPNLINSLDINFLKFIIQDTIFSNGFGWGNKAGVEKLKLLYINIPVKDNNDFDITIQKSIAKKYQTICDLQIKAEDYFKTLTQSTIGLELNRNNSNKLIDLKDLFNFIKGNAGYTRKYFQSHTGEYPVYSGQTSNYGKIANIDTYDFDTNNEKWLTWTTDGIYAGTVFARNGKFSMTTHCGLMKQKPKFPNNIDIEYLQHLLNKILPNYAVGDQNRRVTKEIISNISIEIPTKENGEFDLEEQKQIAKKYNKIEENKSKLIYMLEQIKNTQVKIDEIV